jgi:outer membrane biogenesis lipoprotein LolB
MRTKLVLVLLVIFIITGCQSTENDTKEYDKDSFLKTHSNTYPEIENMFD